MEQQEEIQVWQRVMGSTARQPGTLRPLILSSMEAAALYRHLTMVLTGQAGADARQLLAGERETLAALKGLAVLSGQGRQREKPLPSPAAAPEQLLKTAFFRAKNMAAEYTARSAEGDFGLVFDALARRERRHCTILAEILGSL